MAKTHSIKGDLELLGLAYLGDDQTEGTTRTIQLIGEESNIGLDLVLKGTGVVRVPEGYEDNISSDRDLINRAYANSRLGGVSLGELVTGPGADQDGFSLVYDHTTGTYTLSAVASALTFENGITEDTNVVKLGGSVSDAETNVTVDAQGVLRIRSAYATGSDEAGLEVEGVAEDNNQVRLYSTGGAIRLTPTEAFVTAPGTGALKYVSDYSANFTDRSLPDVAWVNSHLGGKNVDANVVAPTGSEDGYVMAWDNTTSSYKLFPTTAFDGADTYWKLAGTSAIATPTIIGDPTFQGHGLFYTEGGSAIDTLLTLRTTSSSNQGRVVFEIDSDRSSSGNATLEISVGRAGGINRPSVGFQVSTDVTVPYLYWTGYNVAVFGSAARIDDTSRYQFVNPHTQSSGTNAYTLLLLQPTYNTTGTYSGTAIGIDYNPTLTSTTGLTHYAARFRSGILRIDERLLVGNSTAFGTGVSNNILKVHLANDATDNAELGRFRVVHETDTIGVRVSSNRIDGYLSLSGDNLYGSAGYIRLFARNYTTNRGFVINGGSLIESSFTGSASDYDSTITGVSATGTNTTYTEGGNVIINGGAKATAGTNDGNVILANTRGNVGIGTKVFTNSNVFVEISDPVSVGDKDLLRITQTFTRTSSTNYFRGLTIAPTFNTTGTYSGTAYGIYYAPTLTSTTGLTHIAFQNTSGQIRLGGITQDDTKTQVLVKDETTNQVFWRDADTLGGGGTGDYWPLSGTGTLTGSVTMEFGDYDITFQGTDNSLEWISARGTFVSGENIVFSGAGLSPAGGGNTIVSGDNIAISADHSWSAIFGSFNTLGAVFNEGIMAGGGHTLSEGPLGGNAIFGSAHVVSGGSYKLYNLLSGSGHTFNTTQTGVFITSRSDGNTMLGTSNNLSGTVIKNAFVAGQLSSALGTDVFIHGYPIAGQTTRPIIASGIHALNISANSSSQVSGHGALANYSAIIGGQDHNIPADSQRSLILGGNAIKARDTDPDNVYVPYFNITQIAQNDDLTQLLVRDADTGKVYWKDSSTLGGGSSYTFGNGITESSGSVSLGGTVTGVKTISNSFAEIFIDDTDLDGIGINVKANGFGEISASIGGEYWGFLVDASNTIGNGEVGILHSEVGNLMFNSTTGNAVYTSQKSTGYSVIAYAANYSTAFTDRSLVDKAYVDSAIDSIDSITGSLIANRVTYATGPTTITTDAGLTYDDTNNALTVGTARIFNPGVGNLFFGPSAANLLGSVGSNNTALGSNTMTALSGGSGNVAVGMQALFALTSGNNNIGIGYQAGMAITTGSNNIIIGSQIAAQSATANGQLSIQNIIFGDSNTATGTTVSSGTIGIGTVALGARLAVKGKGNTGATDSLALMNSDSEFIFSVSDSCVVSIGSGGTYTVNTGSGIPSPKDVMWINVADVTPISGNAPNGGIFLYADNSSDGTATLGLFLQQAVEAIGTFTPSHKLKIKINGTEYYIQLDAV